MKAYSTFEDSQFLDSDDGRLVRFLAEHLQPLSTFRHAEFGDTIVFFDLARLRHPAD